MPIEEHLILELVTGDDLSLAAFLGLEGEEVQVVVNLAESAVRAGDPQDAAAIFGGLEALEPKRAVHHLGRALAEAAAGDRRQAAAALERYFRAPGHKSDHELAAANQLRESLGPC